MHPTKCDLCDRPAVVHEVTVKSGVKKEVHLCAEHAQEAGVPLPSHQPLSQLLTQFVISQTGKAKSASKKSCPGCGMTFSRFRQIGTLGCPECYEAFEGQLAPLIERAQNAAMHHRGKTPRRAGGTVDQRVEARQLVKELDEAVAAEQYERAAKLRDRLRSLDPETPGSRAADGESEKT